MFTRLQLTLTIFLTFTSVSFAGVPKSFYESKKLMQSIYFDNQKSFYCKCDYNYTFIKGKKKTVVNANSCGYTPRKNINRGKYIEWEHVVPASIIGRNLSCWKDNICINSKGKKYKGRKCCQKINNYFKIAEADMHNLVPAVGELNGDRSNYSFGIVKNKIKRYGSCEFYIENKIVEPRNEIKGDIARIYFYMIDRYKIQIPNNEINVLQYWNKLDQVSMFERVRNQRIKNTQGNSNRFIK